MEIKLYIKLHHEFKSSMNFKRLLSFEPSANKRDLATRTMLMKVKALKNSE